MTTVNDKRTAAEKAATAGFVVFTDTFMSGWGGASFYALAVLKGPRTDTHDGRDPNQGDVLFRNGERRSDMKRGRYVSGSTYRPGRTCAHLTIVGPTAAPRWYEPHGF